MSGKYSRDKGARFERQAVAALQDAGLAAERVPLSGGAGGRFSADISCPIFGIDRRFECKKRAAGFKEIYSWLDGAFGLVIGADRREPLAVIPLSEFARLAALADKARGS